MNPRPPLEPKPPSAPRPAAGTLLSGAEDIGMRPSLGSPSVHFDKEQDSEGRREEYVSFNRALGKLN